MLQVSHFSKALKIEGQNQYGFIKVFFGSPQTFKPFPRLSFEKFLALSHLLENDTVFYDPNKKIFVTSVETADFESYEQKEVE